MYAVQPGHSGLLDVTVPGDTRLGCRFLLGGCMRVSWKKLAQPSTWAGLGLLWIAFSPLAVPWEIVVNAITGVAALMAILLNEGA